MIKPIPDINTRNIERLPWKQKSAGWYTAPVWHRTDPALPEKGDDFSHVDIEAHKLEKGARTDIQAHDDHFELVIVWRGSVNLHTGPAKAPCLLQPRGTAAIPMGQRHQFEQTGNEEAVLITVHALNDKVVKTRTFSAFEPGDGIDLEERNLNQIQAKPGSWEPNPRFRAKRIRIWGKEAGALPSVDAIKQQLQFTLYTFMPEQENPGHFHPHSVEFVFSLSDGVKFMIRPKLERDDWTGVDDRYEKELEAGDLVLVPTAAWHRYINGPKQEALVLAMQTPHPIMHTLLDETNGEFNPDRLPA